MIRINACAFNVGTVLFWRSARKAYKARTWVGAMRAFAAQHGRAIAMLGDDGALIVERGGAEVHHAPSQVMWIGGTHMRKASA